MIKIRKALLSLACAVLASSAWAAAPKYIFYFIGDGMGPGQVMNAETYNRLVLGSEKTLTMSSLPVNSYATTYSASSPVTDSAAAGTALSTGHKTKNGMLGMNPDTIAVTSVAEMLKKNGFGIGIITTVAADDATPGAFYAHVPNRKMYYEIGRQAAESDYEVIAGASMRGASKNGESIGLLEYIESNGVVIAKSLDDMAGTDSRRVMLLPDKALWEWNMGYTIDSIAGEPSLAQITSATIDHLMKHTPDRFFIMAEGGNIDHAGHANDGGTAVKEVLAFDQAIARALEFYNAHPEETLIVVTADHETGGMSVGNNFTGYNTYPQYIAAQRMSKEAFSKYCDRLIEDKTPMSWEEMKAFLTDKFGLYSILPMDEATDARLRQAFDKTFKSDSSSERQETLYADINPFPVEVFKIINDAAGIGWTTLSHTGSIVPLYAIGNGAELFIGQNDNTQIPLKILKAVGL